MSEIEIRFTENKDGTISVSLSAQDFDGTTPEESRSSTDFAHIIVEILNHLKPVRGFIWEKKEKAPVENP